MSGELNSFKNIEKNKNKYKLNIEVISEEFKE